MDFYTVDDASEELDKNTVGGKGHFLHAMKKDGLPVPPACIITTQMWQEYRKNPKTAIKKLKTDTIPAIMSYIKEKNAGDLPLMSVRSSGAVSMPGMMDTILNVGVTQKYFKDLGFPKPEDDGSIKPVSRKKLSSSRVSEEFLADNYARFLSMYGSTVLGIKKEHFPAPSDKGLRTIAEVEAVFSEIYRKAKQKMPSQRPEEQLLQCILAVFNSWDNEHAVLYRKMNNIDENAGTAVVVQQMVFGNKNDLSATGVLFSRNPSTGVNELTGEYLVRAQGEDVVSGAVTPVDMAFLKEEFPDAYKELSSLSEKLEKKYKTMQDIEWTMESGKVYVLQSRTAKCSPLAKLKMLMDMHKFKEIEASDVFSGLTKEEFLALNIKQVDPSFTGPPDGEGLPASTGALSGRVVFGPSSKYEEPTILVAQETTPEDLDAIQMSKGILTASGGATSHAAVVARSLSKVCVVGCTSLKVDAKNQKATLSGKPLQSGDWITIDALSGRVWLGKDIPIQDAKNNKLFWDLEQLVMDENPSWTRVTSCVDEIVHGNKTYYLTYLLDGEDPDFVEKELSDALDYLTGTIDLTGKLDYMEKNYPKQFLFSDIAAREAFLEKVAIIERIAILKNIRELGISVYLGPYEEEFGPKMRGLGFTVLESSDITFNEDESKALKDTGQINVQQSLKDIPNLAISSRNALLGVLKAGS